MTAVILRRRALGLTSCRGIVEAMEEPCTYARTDQPHRWPDDVDLVIRWGCTDTVPTRNVLNTAQAIRRVNDKAGFRRVLDEEELCPRTWLDIYSTQLAEFLNEHDLPVLLRPRNHAQGRGMHVCDSYDELEHYHHTYGEDGYYLSEIIDKVAEYRVFVAQGRAVWVAQKTPGNPDDIAWNVARGGRFDNVRWDNWPLKAVRVSIEAFNLSGLDFGGVDVVVDADNNAYVVEINSAPSQTSPYRQSCVARVFDYIIRNGKDAIPLITERGGYRKFLHPAINSRALTP